MELHRQLTDRISIVIPDGESPSGETNMSTAAMIERIAEASPRPKARITGVVYFLYFLTAVFSMLFLKGLLQRTTSWRTSLYFGWG
jgi:hypothetical protein